jgi:hypothetical protein
LMIAQDHIRRRTCVFFRWFHVSLSLPISWRSAVQSAGAGFP